VIETVKAAEKAGSKGVVLSLGIGSDAKAIKRVIEAIKKTSPTISFACVSSEGEGNAIKPLRHKFHHNTTVATTYTIPQHKD
jgi:hypothetical protein